LPPFSVTIKAFFASIADGELPVRVWASLKILSLGYAMGVVLAGILTTLAITTRIGNDFLETLTSMFNPLPAIALLPLALLWFGLKPMSLAIVLIHSVLWPVALNTHAGFVAVSPTMRMVGRNYGLRGLVYVVKILIPAALSQHLGGLEDRLGLRLADLDRSRTRLRRDDRRWRARLVHRAE
jgi:NitT/TauT family transport system permease protein